MNATAADSKGLIFANLKTQLSMLNLTKVATFQREHTNQNTYIQTYIVVIMYLHMLVHAFGYF